MTRLVRGLSVSLAALVVLLGAVPRAAEASLIGDSVTCAGDGAAFACNPTTATVGSGTEFNFVLTGTLVLLTLDVGASTITIRAATDIGFSGPSDKPVAFGDLDSPLGAIVNASLSVGTGITGLNGSDLSFTADSVRLVLGGSSPSNWPIQGSTAVISLTFENSPAALPVPGTLVLLASGVAGAGTAHAWRRRFPRR